MLNTINEFRMFTAGYSIDDIPYSYGGCAIHYEPFGTISSVMMRGTNRKLYLAAVENGLLELRHMRLPRDPLYRYTTIVIYTDNNTIKAITDKNKPRILKSLTKRCKKHIKVITEVYGKKIIFKNILEEKTKEKDKDVINRILKVATVAKETAEKYQISERKSINATSDHSSDTPQDEFITDSEIDEQEKARKKIR